MWHLGEMLLTLTLTFCDQVELHITMLFLVLVLDPSTWMMLLVLQVLVSYWNALVGQSQHITVFTLLMLVWDVKVIFSDKSTFECYNRNSATILLLQFHAVLVTSDWLEVMFQMRGEWSSV